MSDAGREPAPVARHRGWTLAAALTFLAATALVYHPVLLAGIARTTPRTSPTFVGDDMGRLLQQMDKADHYFHVWLVSRGARALTLHPHRFFDAGHCYPAKQSLAFGENLLTLSLLAIPTYWLSGEDPELTYNVTMMVSLLLAAAAMFVLVRRWTGSPPAAVAAALLYAFHRARLADTTHGFSYDTAWTVLALFFADRLFERARWRDAAGLALCGALQLGAGFYPVIGAALLALPFSVWLLLRHRLRAVHVPQLLLVALVVGLAAAFIYSPYLSLRSSGALEARTKQAFALWSMILPGNLFFPGWPAVLLALAGLGLACGPEGQSRRGLALALGAGALLVLVIAVGPFLLGRDAQLASYPWAWLAQAFPGLDNVRAILRVVTQAHTAVAVLAGFGFAAVVRRLPAAAQGVVTPLLLLAVAAEVLRAWVPQTGSEVVYAVNETQPPDETLSFFRDLELLGNRGPIFEWPHGTGIAVVPYADRLSVAAYHKRPLSTCFGSYWPDESRAAGIRSILPSPAALIALDIDGFTTLIVHHEEHEREEVVRRFDAQTVDNGGLLRKILGSKRMTAYEIRPAGAAPPAKQ